MLRLCNSWFNLRFKINVGRGHLGNLEDADGQRDGTQDKQTVIDQDTGQDGMSDILITGDKRWIFRSSLYIHTHYNTNM